MDKFIKDSSIEYLIIFRMIPGPPLMLQNILLSLFDISVYNFIISTIVGATPIIFFSIMIGNKINNLVSVNNITVTDILTWDLLIIILLIVIIIITRIIYKNKNKKSPLQ